MATMRTSVEGVLVLEPRVFGDDRGFFFESYNERRFAEETGFAVQFLQDNHSRSVKGVLRGLHYQVDQIQGKLIRAIVGAIFDVAVDLRRSSPTFRRWTGVELTAENKRQLWVPGGCAHGFLVTSDVAEVLYKTSDYYAAEHERAIAWNDPELAIDWPLDGTTPILSMKDGAAPLLSVASAFD